MYTEDYYKLQKNVELPANYKKALTDFMDKIVKLNPLSIILYGGLARELTAKEGWSDIDFVVIFTELDISLMIVISDIKKEITQLTGIDLDINVIEKSELENNSILSVKYNAKYMNIFSKRPNISLVLYGKIIDVEYQTKDEKLASIFRINDAIFQFRKELLDGTYLNLDNKSIVGKIRRTNAIVRASLVVMGYYVHPYEGLIDCLNEILPEYDVEILKYLLSIRNGSTPIDCKELFFKMVDFLEDYLEYFSFKMGIK